MSKQLTFLLECEGETLSLAGGEFDVLDYDGLESTSYQLNTNVNIIGNGETIQSVRLLAREIMLKFDLIGTADKQTVRDHLIWFFRPKVTGTLYVKFNSTERCIDYMVSSLKFDNKNVYEKLTTTVYLKAADPEFREADDIVVDLTSRSGGWQWPFNLPFHMRDGRAQSKNIVNNGHLASPVEIIFYGPAETPTITNVRTGEFIQLSRNLAEGETLYINTKPRHKEVKVIASGTETDAFGAITEASTFFQLEPGDNMITYESGSLTPTGAEIHYRPLYYGI